MRTIGRSTYKAIKYNLHNGWDLILADDPVFYSRTISADVAWRIFDSDLLSRAMLNYTMSDSPYYGSIKDWQETPIS